MQGTAFAFWAFVARVQHDRMTSLIRPTRWPVGYPVPMYRYAVPSGHYVPLAVQDLWTLDFGSAPHYFDAAAPCCCNLPPRAEEQKILLLSLRSFFIERSCCQVLPLYQHNLHVLFCSCDEPNYYQQNFKQSEKSFRQNIYCRCCGYCRPMCDRSQ